MNLEIETLFKPSQLQRINSLRAAFLKDHLERYGKLTEDAVERALVDAIEAFETEAMSD